ncbi:MAG: hypothetical protein ABI905_07270 [Betaproteobacteria bacterium]
MESESITAVKRSEARAGRRSDFAERVITTLVVVLVLGIYLSFQFAFGWVTEYLPAWLYYGLLVVGALIWLGDVLRRVSDWMEKDLARMDAKTKADRARLQASPAKDGNSE